MADEPAKGPAPGPGASRAARFFVPRGHRLFAVFDDRLDAVAALEDLPAVDSGDTWFFEGAAGAAELDPDRGTGAARLFSWVFSHNVEYLRGLSRTVAGGKVIVAVPARDIRAAEGASSVLRRRRGRVLAYTAHWNFVPMTP